MTMRFRKGDKVSLIAIVTHDCEDDEKDVFLRLVDDFRDVIVPFEHVTMVEPRFEVGDSVAWRGGHGTILAIHDAYAWICNAGYCTRHLTSITRVFHEEITT